MNTPFSHKKLRPDTLLPFGFERQGDRYIYQTVLPSSGFQLTVAVSEEGPLSTALVDPASGEPYTLHLAGGAKGSFVATVKAEYEQCLRTVANQCFEPDVFRSEQARQLIAHIRAQYKTELEFLWEKFPKNAIWRRPDTGKWYGVLAHLSRRKLGLSSDESADCVILRLPPEEQEHLVDGKTYFPGYHMNKKHWYTVLLDGSVPLSELEARLAQSYQLAK